MLVTKNELLEIACQQDAIMTAERPNKVLGMTNDTFHAAHTLQRQAMSAALWMEQGGIDEIPQIGPFGRLDLKRGDKVRIKAGAVILSMHPKYTRQNPKVAKKDYIVTIHSVNDGWISSHWHDHRRDSGDTHRVQTICWPGEGSYWCYLETAFVEKVD